MELNTIRESNESDREKIYDLLNENDELRKKLLDFEHQTKKLHGDLEHEKQAAAKGPSAAAKEQINRLKQQLQEKEEELQVCAGV